MNIPIYPHGSRDVIVDLLASPRPCRSDAEGDDGARAATGLSGMQRRYSKREIAAYPAQTLGWLKNAYEEAIEFTGMTRELRGMAFMYGIAFGLLFTVGIGGCGVFAIVIGSFQTWQEAMIMCGGAVLAAAGIAVGSYLFLLLVRIDLFRPSDLPIIFDRKHRKIYRLLRDEQPGFKGMFMRWPIIACEYDWDLVDAEHHCTTFASAASVHRNHHLVFLVRRSHDDPTVIDTFQIANAHALGENLVDPLWEHIRQFMEEGGPHLPHPSEPLASQEAPLSWWDSMGDISPFGPKFAAHWSKAPFLTLVIVLLWPVTLPIHILWGTGNYLSFKTQVAIEWPTLVMQRIGPLTAAAPTTS